MPTSRLASLCLVLVAAAAASSASAGVTLSDALSLQEKSRDINTGVDARQSGAAAPVAWLTNAPQPWRVQFLPFGGTTGMHVLRLFAPGKAMTLASPDLDFGGGQSFRLSVNVLPFRPSNGYSEIRFFASSAERLTDAPGNAWSVRLDARKPKAGMAELRVGDEVVGTLPLPPIVKTAAGPGYLVEINAEPAADGEISTSVMVNGVEVPAINAGSLTQLATPDNYVALGRYTDPAPQDEQGSTGFFGFEASGPDEPQ